MKRSIAALLAPALLIAACGGSDDGDAEGTTTAPETTAPETTVPETTVPPTTAPPTTAPETTVPPTTAPPTTAAPTTTAVTVPPEFAAFCRESEAYYVTTRAIFEYSETGGAAALLWADAIAAAERSVSAAPNAELAAQPAAALEALRTLALALEPVDFDPTRVDSAALTDPITTIDDTTERLVVFLEEACGTDLTAADSVSEQVAADAEQRAAAGETPAPTDTSTETAAPGETTEITDDSGVLRVTVPAAWTEVRGAPLEDARQLIAAADADGFLAGFDVPGLNLVAGDSPDAAATAPAFREVLLAGAEQAGCSLVDALSYDDTVYTGQEDILDCPDGDSTVYFITGSNEEGTTWFALGLIVAAGDETTRALVGDTFFID